MKERGGKGHYNYGSELLTCSVESGKLSGCTLRKVKWEGWLLKAPSDHSQTGSTCFLCLHLSLWCWQEIMDSVFIPESTVHARSWLLTTDIPQAVITLLEALKYLRTQFGLTMWILLLKWPRALCSKVRAGSQCCCRRVFLNVPCFSQVVTKFSNFSFLRCNAMGHP